MSKFISEEQFGQFKELMASAECVTKEVSMSAIRLDDNSIRQNYIILGDQKVSVAPGFFTRLAAMVKVNASLTKEMLKNEDAKIATALINGLKEYRSSGGKGSVLLIANPTTAEIIDICDPNKFRRLTNESMLDVTTKILNDHSSLSLETMNFDPRTGRSQINFLNQQEVGFPGAGKDEFFKFGFSIVQSSKDTRVEMYNQRLVCSNGMRVNLGSGAIGGNNNIQFEETFRLGGTKAEDIKGFLNKVEAMSKAGFVPGAFRGTLQNAVETRASLQEVESALVHTQRLVSEEDPNMKKHYIDDLSRNYFHGYTDALARVTRKGHNPMALNDKQKGLIKTNMSVWDVVNSLTFLGSNNSGIPLVNQWELKNDAGSLFGKGTKEGYDLQFAQFAQL